MDDYFVLSKIAARLTKSWRNFTIYTWSYLFETIPMQSIPKKNEVESCVHSSVNPFGTGYICYQPKKSLSNWSHYPSRFNIYLIIFKYRKMAITLFVCNIYLWLQATLLAFSSNLPVCQFPLCRTQISSARTDQFSYKISTSMVGLVRYEAVKHVTNVRLHKPVQKNAENICLYRYTKNNWCMESYFGMTFLVGTL